MISEIRVDIFIFSSFSDPQIESSRFQSFENLEKPTVFVSNSGHWNLTISHAALSPASLALSGARTVRSRTIELTMHV